VEWAQLRQCLLRDGEPVSESDLDSFLLALTGSASSAIADHTDIDPKYFAESLLGFEDFN
jgi:hypothetical protein